MCFTKRIETKEERIPLIAEKNIPVWKTLTATNCSPIHSFKYDKGFHYYNTGKEPLGIKVKKYRFGRTKKNADVHAVLIVSEGLHSYKSEVRCWYGNAIKMYIPKGAKYFENDYCYVSSELVWY